MQSQRYPGFIPSWHQLTCISKPSTINREKDPIAGVHLSVAHYGRKAVHRDISEILGRLISCFLALLWRWRGRRMVFHYDRVLLACWKWCGHPQGEIRRLTAIKSACSSPSPSGRQLLNRRSNTDEKGGTRTVAEVVASKKNGTQKSTGNPVNHSLQAVFVLGVGQNRYRWGSTDTIHPEILPCLSADTADHGGQR